MNRIKYYLGEFYDKQVEVRIEDIPKNKNTILLDPKNFEENISIQEIKKNDINNYYFYPEYLRQLLKETKIKNNVIFNIKDYNDNPKLLPILCKTRRENNNNILINFKRYRHMNLVETLVKKPDITFHLKKNKMIWRGRTTGKTSKKANRYTLVKKYYNHKEIDIGFCRNKFINNNELVGMTKDIFSEKEKNLYFKNPKEMIELLKYKYLISVEGNEVASGLKWMLYSNSVVLMAKPRNFSWIMEDKLIPYFHYIPLKDDFSDLEEKYSWCLNNNERCKYISKNATNYMKQFLDINKEREIEREVIRIYNKNIKII